MRLVTSSQLTAHVIEALRLALLLGLPALCASVLAGLVSSALQAATQVQDPALSFVPRLLAVALTLYASAGFMQRELVVFTTAIFGELSRRGP